MKEHQKKHDSNLIHLSQIETTELSRRTRIYNTSPSIPFWPPFPVLSRPPSVFVVSSPLSPLVYGACLVLYAGGEMMWHTLGTTPVQQKNRTKI